jgi:hypothetical protein
VRPNTVYLLTQPPGGTAFANQIVEARFIYQKIVLAKTDSRGAIERLSCDRHGYCLYRQSLAVG